MEVASETNQEVAAEFLKEQNRELPQIAGDRQDIKQIELQLKEPDQAIIGRHQQIESPGRSEISKRIIRQGRKEGKGSNPITKIGAS